MTKYLLAFILYFTFPISIFAQEEQEITSEPSYFIEGYDYEKPDIVSVNDPATIQVYNEIIALRPTVEEAFARAHLKIAEDDLDEYQSALRRIEQAERHESYDGQDALVVAYADLNHVLGVIARLEALSTPAIESSITSHSDTTSIPNDELLADADEVSYTFFFPQLLQLANRLPLHFIQLFYQEPTQFLLWCVDLILN